MSTPLRSSCLLACALALGTTSRISAAESFIVGPRALGMGGTGVACVNDVQAQYYNPAAFGFFSYGEAPGKDVSHRPIDNQNLYDKDWGFAVDVNAGLRIHDRFADYANNLKDVYDSNLIQNLEHGSYTLTAADVQKLGSFATAINGIDSPEEYATADLSAGFGLRILHLGIGVRAYGEALMRVSEVDLTHLGGFSTSTLASSLGTGTAASGYTYTYSQISSISGLSDYQKQQLDQLAAQGNLSNDQVTQLVSTINTAGATSGSIIDNQTTVLVRGVGFAEIPVSYGYALSDHLSIGGSVKFIKGRLYGTSVRVFDDKASDTLRDAKNNYHDTATGSIDLGVMGRWEKFQAGIVGRNLTRPKFKGFDYTVTLSDGTVVPGHVDDYTLDPSAAVGLAFIPVPWFTLAADADLTRNKTIYPDYKTQRVGIGAEVNAFYVLALRCGVMQNIAESDVGRMYTAGLGLNLWAMRLDVAGAMSAKTTTFDGNKVPREARLAAQVAVDF